MSKITVALLLGGLLVLLAIGAAHAVPTGVIYDPTMNGANTADGQATSDNYDWYLANPWQGNGICQNRIRVEQLSHWSGWNLTGDGIMFDPSNQNLDANGLTAGMGWTAYYQNGWYNGSGHGAGDILMAANTTYKFTVQYETYGNLFNGGGLNSTNYLQIGYNVEPGNTFYWSNGSIDKGSSYNPTYGINAAVVVDYATGANNWQTASFTVSNTTGANEAIVLGAIAEFGVGNGTGFTNSEFWDTNGYTKVPNMAFSAIGDWTMTPVPEPGSLLALSTGLIGLLGAALRKRA
jgi:hypothetical protein